MNARPRKLLVAVDGSVASLEAARLAVRLAGAWEAELHVVAVHGEAPAERLLDATEPSGPPARERRKAQLQGVLDYVRRLAIDAGVTVEASLCGGPGARPYELILQEADRWHADLLFLGRSSHRGLGRALLGSQTEHVLEFAHLPVVVVPESASGRGGAA